jgi:inner membrane protein
MHALRAHRGLTHALIAAPAVALVATLLTWLLFRRARLTALFARALVAVPVAHLLPDLWTGWGTRLFLPFSERRFALDWTMVLDPFVTLPLVVAAVVSLVKRGRFRLAFRCALLACAGYLAFRVASLHHLEREVRAAYPTAASVDVFPAPFSPTRYRYVARVGEEFAAGSVGLGRSPREQARAVPYPGGPLPERLAGHGTVQEALDWARFPVVRHELDEAEGARVEIADLRYHLHGTSTLTFSIALDRDGSVREARLDRGGSARELWRRFRQGE